MSEPLDGFFGAGNTIRPALIDPTFQSLLENWESTIRDGGIGFLPRGAEQRIYWYAFAPSARLRRELLGLLDAWVGPTYSDLTLGRGALDLSDPFDLALAKLDVSPLRFEVLPRVAPHSTQAKNAVRHALTILTRLVNQRPPSQFDAMRTTVEILDDLGHAITAQDRALAESSMAELQRSADLDESNLAFLRLRLYAGMGDWAAMFKDPALDHILSMRRPLSVTRAIQSGVYHERLKHLDHLGAEPALRKAAEELGPGLRELFTGAPPANRPEAVVELVCRLLTTPSTSDPAIARLITIAGDIQPGLDGYFYRIANAYAPESTTTVAPVQEPPPSPGVRVAALMLQGEFVACIELGLVSPPSVEVGRALVYSARQLSSVEWAASVIEFLESHDLKEAVAATTPLLRSDVEWLDSFCGDRTLRGWRDWFATLGSSDATSSKTPNEATQTWEALPSAEVFELIRNASEAELAQLGEQGGQFLAAHSELFHSPDSPEITLSLIGAMALSGKASAGVRVQTLSLIESLSAAAPSRSTYEDVVEWTAEILAVNIAATTVSWACDVLQALTSIPTQSDTGVMLSFFNRTINALRPYRSALDIIDVEALDVVATELGTQAPADFRATHAKSVDEDPAVAYRYLEGKTLVLYSLMETATTRASQVLRRLVPSIDVRTNAEHTGSPRLAQLSSNADVFVVVTVAAKHAATIFISDRRGNLPIVWVNSRGSSSILRALADLSPR